MSSQFLVKRCKNYSNR